MVNYRFTTTNDDVAAGDNDDDGEFFLNTILRTHTHIIFISWTRD